MSSVAIIGSGFIGKNWAIIFARGGFKVKLYDSIEGLAAKSIFSIHQQLEELHKVGLLTAPVQQVLALITATNTLTEVLNDVFYVQECVPETLELKRKIFAELDEALPSSEQNVILASSTSNIPSSQFIVDMKHHQTQVLVAHPVNPPVVIPIVEIVPNGITQTEIIEKACNILKKVEMKPVLLKQEHEGFVVNNLQYALLREAMRLVEQGIASPADIDTAICDGLGLRWSFMGPFKTIDLNAPGGVIDYFDRYGDGIYHVSKQQDFSQKWKLETVQKINDDIRIVNGSVANLESVRNWRNQRLMALAIHKKQQENPQ